MATSITARLFFPIDVCTGQAAPSFRISPLWKPRLNFVTKCDKIGR